MKDKYHKMLFLKAPNLIFDTHKYLNIYLTVPQPGETIVSVQLMVSVRHSLVYL